MKSSSSIISTCSTALLLLLASSVASASDSNSDKLYRNIAEQASTFAYGVPETSKYTHQSWTNTWDCKQHNSFPPDPVHLTGSMVLVIPTTTTDSIVPKDV